MAEYLYGVQEGVHVFDLAKTRECLLAAMEAITAAVRDGKTIVLVGTKKQIKSKVRELAQKTGIMFVNERWLGGTLTNFNQVGKSIKKLAEMKDKMGKGEYSEFTKKERLLIERKIEDLEKSLGGLTGMNRLPDLMIIIDTHKERGTVKEAQALGIKTVGVVDSNADPNFVTYPIPMNDDATKSLELIMNCFEQAIEEGKAPVKKAKTKKTKDA